MSSEEGRLFIGDLLKNIGATMRTCCRTGLRVLLCFALSELILSILAPGYRHQVFDSEFTGGWPVAVDASGQRGAVVPLEKSAGEYRILVLGDSVAFGTGVAAIDSWPGQLPELINGRGTKKITCINAAMPGRGIKDNLADFRDQWARYQPDVVLLAVTNNMVAISNSQRSRQTVHPRNEYLQGVSPHGLTQIRNAVNRYSKYLVTPSWISVQVQRISYWAGLSNHNMNASDPFGPMLAYGYLQADLSPTTTPTAWDQFESDLGDFCDEVEQSCGDVRVVTFPTRFMLSNSWLDNEKCVPLERLTLNSESEFAAVCERLGVKVLETGIGFREALGTNQASHAGDWFLHFDFTHLTPHGHELVAAFVALNLAADEPWNNARDQQR